MKVDRDRVGDVLALQRRAVDVEIDGQYAEIGVRSFGRGIFHKEPVSGLDLGNKRVFHIKPGDLVISNVFAWEGAVAVATGAESGKIGSHRFMTFTPVENRISTTWAYWFFISEPGLELIRQASPGSAGRNRTLAVDRFEALEIPLPQIDEQRRVAAQLDRLAGRRATVDHDVARQPAETIIASLPSLIDEITSHWANGSSTVGDAADIVPDVVHPGDEPSPAGCFVGLQHVESHTGRRFGVDLIDEMKGRKFRFQPGDIVYGYLRPYLNKVWVADRHGLCSVDQYVLRPHKGVDSELLAYMLRGRATLDSAIALTHNLQLPRLRSGLLESLAIPKVPDHFTPHLVMKLDHLRDRIVTVAEKRQQQRATVDALLPAALNEAFAGLS